jgi:hypothetical protein
MKRRSRRGASRARQPRLEVRQRLGPDSEPLAEGEDWVEWGGERIWAAGFTEGGAPYGMTVTEFREMSLAREVHAWALEHLPPDEPAVLLHGDLLGQNILLRPREALGLIDWERAQLGDPAYDLAIVTRGARQPFQIAGGLDRLLESYAGQATEIKKDNVHLYELCLLARWYRESLTGPRSHPSAELLNRLRGHFRRTVSAAA